MASIISGTESGRQIAARNGDTAPTTTGSKEQSVSSAIHGAKAEAPDTDARSKESKSQIVESKSDAKPSAAELKKQKQAEKAARRAGKVADRTAEAQRQGQQLTTQTPQGGPSPSPQQKRRPSTNKKDVPKDQSAGSRSLPNRPKSNVKEQSPSNAEKMMDKRVPMVSHLYPPASSKRASFASAGREIHPAVLTLGLQLRDYVICGANARTVAMLLVFKKVIQSYNTPVGVALSRHLTQHLSGQITYLSHARPLSISQGNSIRWLKKLISALDPDLGELEAKTFLCKAIDSFIREKITLADEVISKEASNRIEDEGDVIITYGKSSIVEKALLSAWNSGKRFKVICVDSKPMFEGQNLARSLVRAGMTDIQYCLLSGLADAIEQEGVTKCLLGASAMLGNGRLSARAGTAMVAMMAKAVSPARGKVPVLVLCETVKFTAKVALDPLIMNEVADADLLVEKEDCGILTNTNPQPKQETLKKGAKPVEPEEPKQEKGLEGWKDQQNLYLLNLMYDVTPAEYLDMVISELGSLPPTAVPVVNGVHGDDE